MTMASTMYNALMKEKDASCNAAHCDASVLHAPGECEYCDLYPYRQELRKLWGVAFTGHEPKENELQCPSTWRRSLERIERWSGNVKMTAERRRAEDEFWADLSKELSE